MFKNFEHNIRSSEVIQDRATHGRTAMRETLNRRGIKLDE